MRRAVVALALLLGGGVACAQDDTLDRAAFLQLARSVLKIEVIRQQGGYSLGSGVVVAPHKVVTNCHVTRDAVEIHVLRDGGRWPVRAQASDVGHDLCLLDAPAIDDGEVSLGRSASLKPGQPVVALGYTGGVGIQTSAGEVLSLHHLDGASVVQSSNWFNSGASGGGLFDRDQRLVGILTFRLRGGQAHYFAAPVEWIKPLLDEARPGRAIGPFAPQELAFWQRPLDEQPDFLKAAVLERDRDWPRLEALATAWSRRLPDEAEPWYWQAVAHARLGHKPQAEAARERLSKLDASLAGALAKAIAGF